VIQKIYIILAILFVASTLYAADLGVGISAWYADWEMESNPGNDPINMNEVLYIGPSIAYQFSDKWSTTLVALATPQKYKDVQTEYRRYDMDFALNYHVSRYVKVFGGAKYLAFVYNNTMNTYNGIHHAVGPGAGISLTIPVLTNFYILANMSGIYIIGNEKTEDTTGTTNNNFYEFGGSSALQIAYYIPSIAITFAVGYRYQYIESHYKNTGSNNSILEHTFKGFTVLLVKSFEL
jgi:hypothetical protein